jgi:N utilization substance protein B
LAQAQRERRASSILGRTRRDRIESRARARALQALYAWDVRGAAFELARVAEDLWDGLSVPAPERALAEQMIQTVVNAGPAIDPELAAVTTHWRLERLGVIERCVLRLGAAELLQGTTPPRVIIHEALRLAERYGTDASAKFVNGVLDAVARRQGQL